MADWTRTHTFMDGTWLEGNQPIIGPRTHAFWLGSSVFDGARAFEGVTPDLDLHLARANASAEAMDLKPSVSLGEMMEIAAEGIAKFPAGTPLYIRPMYWAEKGGPLLVACEPESTRFLLCLYEAAMPGSRAISLTVSPFRRPTLETMPTNAKTGALYPNNARALREAQSRGFNNTLVLDLLGNVAETATANVFMVKDGVVATPVPNHTFLNGITRQRVIRLLREAGTRVDEVTLKPKDFYEADEIFCTGNYSKLTPVSRIGEREMQEGPLYQLARRLYWDFAHA